MQVNSIRDSWSKTIWGSVTAQIGRRCILIRLSRTAPPVSVDGASLLHIPHLLWATTCNSLLVLGLYLCHFKHFIIGPFYYPVLDFLNSLCISGGDLIGFYMVASVGGNK